MKPNVLLSASLILLTVALMPATQADIYKCKDEHGNVAYLQTPCPVKKAEEPPATEQDEEVTESSPERQPAEVRAPTSRRSGESLVDCKRRYRDQIDEIDAEMRTAFTPEQGAAYKEKLLALTRELRLCE